MASTIDEDRDDAAPKSDLRFVFCFDYGTTYTGVAWALTTGDAPTLADINVIDRWGERIAPKVPSLITFAANKGSLWGYDIGDTLYVIRLSKLELEAMRRADALAVLKRTLEEAQLLDFGPQHVIRKRFPRHLTKSPSDVVTSYLIKVADQVRRVIRQEKDKRTLREFPMDLIITHPAEWDYKARNLTFRAVNEAFRQIFPESLDGDGVIRLATEPEACAQFTMRHAQDQGISRLRKGHCFICVDAGGGTVDLVSYIVDGIDPFRVRKITPASGARCGATRIDDAFLKEFLPQRLGKRYHDRILEEHGPEKHARGAHVVLTRYQQILLERFQEIKHNFAGRPPPDEADPGYPLELIEGLGLPHEDTRVGIIDDHLQISSADLEGMFKVSVDGTLELIEKQLTLVERQRGRVTTVFLSGGLSQSPYLYNCVEELTQGWDFKLVRAPESWSAVAPGGVLMGLGVGCVPPPPCVACPYHIGVVLAERWTDYNGFDASQKYEDTFDNQLRVQENIKWLVAKGDLITQDEGIEISQPIVRKFGRNGSKTGTLTIVLSALDGFSEPPTQVNNTLDNQRQTLELGYDLTDYPMSLATHQDTNSTYYKLEMHLEISINQRGAHIELVAGKTRDLLGRTAAAGTRLAYDDIAF